jgi:hypothetical protein
MKKKAATQLGMIGLGRIGSNMVRRLIRGGHQCVVFNRLPQKVKDWVNEKAVGTSSLADLVENFRNYGAVWLMVPAEVVDSFISDLLPLLASGDILIHGGNSYYGGDAQPLTQQSKTCEHGKQKKCKIPCKRKIRRSSWRLLTSCSTDEIIWWLNDSGRQIIFSTVPTLSLVETASSI